MDDVAHQSEHAPGALESVKRRPVLVEPIEQLRVQRVGRFDPSLVCRLARLARELAGVPGVELHERPRDRRDIRERGC